jgi:hypothetical protein
MLFSRHDSLCQEVRLAQLYVDQAEINSEIAEKGAQLAKISLRSF